MYTQKDKSSRIASPNGRYAQIRISIMYMKPFSLEQWFLSLLLEGYCLADFSSNLPHHIRLYISQQDNCSP